MLSGSAFGVMAMSFESVNSECLAVPQFADTVPPQSLSEPAPQDLALSRIPSPIGLHGVHPLTPVSVPSGTFYPSCTLCGTGHISGYSNRILHVPLQS